MIKALVSNVYGIHGDASLLISEDTPLRDLIIRFASEPSLRGLFLVDSRQLFAGVVTRIDLLRWAHFSLSRGKGRREMPVSEFFRIVDARKARDVASGDLKALSVRENDSLQTALDKMLDNEEDVIAVLDAEGRVVGDLRLSEVLTWLLRQGYTDEGDAPR